MPDFAKERGGIALGGEAVAPSSNGGAPAAPLFSVRILSRQGFGDATRALDGIGGLGWSVIGFIVGAVFWHFIGFWGFVADVVLAGGGHPAAQQTAYWSAPGPVVAQAEAPSVVAANSAKSCTDLVLDRRTGATVARPCPAIAPVLPADRFQGREDRVAAAEPTRR